MIAIHKGDAPPDLVCAGEDHARELCAAYDADPELYQRRERKMDVRASIYASDAVKTELQACQHGKCCYCETLIPRPYALLYIEHWRPKSSSRQGWGEQRLWPGYYWLAYRWDNLLLSCFFCNSSKSDLFPLEDPAVRARHHGMPVEDEAPAILKPDGDQDLSAHITFHEEVPVGVTPLGRKTIEVLGLDSPAHELRLSRLAEIRKARDISINLTGSDDPIARQWAESFRRFVEQAVGPEMPYSAMAAAFLKANPLPSPV